MSAASRARWCSRALSRTAMVAGATTAGLLLLTVPALAHITITPGSAPPGSTAVLTFHIPNEESKADTTKVDMQIPTDHPIAQLLVKPVPGWTISVRTVTLAKPLVTDDGSFSQAVSEVIWSGGQIAPGQFQDFTISADPLPKGVGQLTFKAIQTYSNGDVVRWIDVPQPGQPEPDHPAPVLTLAAGGAPAAPAAAGASSAGTSRSGGSDAMARGIAAGGVVIGLIGLTLAGLSWRRGKMVVITEPLAPTPDGLVMTSAVQPAQAPNGTQSRNGRQPGNGSQPPTATQNGNGAQSRRAGAPARETPRRKSAGSGRRRTHR